MTDNEDVNNQAKKKAPTAMEVARAVLKAGGGRLIQINGEIKRLTGAERTWVDWTNPIRRQISLATGGSPRTVLEVLEGFIGAPRPSEYRCTPYYVWNGEQDDDGEADLLNSHWEPFTLGASEIAFFDGRLNLVTGRFEKLKECLFGPLIMLEYEKTRKPRATDKFKQFLRTLELAMPDPAARLYFQKTMATILQPHVNQKSGIFLVGPSGCRKTTIATAISTAPGGIAGYSVETIDDLAQSRFSRNSLLNKWVNLSDDAPGDNVRWVHWFKRYTGSSVMSVEAKYVQARNYPTTAKLIICCNNIPIMEDESDAILPRLNVFKLVRAGELDDRFKDGSGDSNYLNTEYWNDEDTRACIVNWMIDGLKLTLAEGRQTPAIVKTWNTVAQSESNTLRDTLLANFEKGAPGEFMSSIEILGQLKAEGIQCNGHLLCRFMRSLFEVEPIRKHKDGRLYRGYAVKLRELA